MDEVLIANWNAKVHRDDVVYIVGDLIWQSSDPTPYFAQLKGKKHLIVGNHDKWLAKYDVAHYFEEITQYAEVSVDGHPITFCHYPMLEWKNSRKEGSSRLGYLVHGHIHNNVYPPSIRNIAPYSSCPTPSMPAWRSTATPPYPSTNSLPITPPSNNALWRN